MDIRSIIATIGAQSQETFIALEDGRIMGQVLVRYLDRRVAQFSWLAVREKGIGTGTMLLKCAELRAKQSGCASIACQIDADNRDIAEWYTERGYVLAGDYEDGTMIAAKAL